MVICWSRKVSRSPSEASKLESRLSHLVTLQSQLYSIMEDLEKHKERQSYLEYLVQVEKDLDNRIASVLEKLLQALGRLHVTLEETQPVLQSLSLPKSTLSEILSFAVRITGSLSAPTNYQEESLDAAHFAPAPTEEMIRESKMAQWNMNEMNI